MSFLFAGGAEKFFQALVDRIHNFGAGRISFFLPLYVHIDQTRKSQFAHVVGDGRRAKFETPRQFGGGEFFPG